MYAIQLKEFSGPLVVEEVTEPVAGPDEVLVDLIYGTVNPLDVWCCNGNFAAMTPLPHIPGAEGLGTANGKTVIVNGNGVGLARSGTYAQRIAAPYTYFGHAKSFKRVESRKFLPTVSNRNRQCSAPARCEAKFFCIRGPYSTSFVIRCIERGE